MKNYITAFEIYLRIKETTAYLISQKNGVKKQSVYNAVGNPKGVEVLKGRIFFQVGNTIDISPGVVLDSVREIESILTDKMVRDAFAEFPEKRYVDKEKNISISQRKVLIILFAEAFQEFYFEGDTFNPASFKRKVKKYLQKNKSRFKETNTGGEREDDE